MGKRFPVLRPKPPTHNPRPLLTCDKPIRTRAYMLVLLLAVSARAGKKRKKRGPSASTAAAMQHHQRGTMAHVHGDHDGAKAAFREAVKLKPDFAYAYFRLGFVMHEQEQQERLRQKANDGPRRPRPTEDPVPVFREAIRLDGTDEMVYYSLGQALKDRLDLRAAAETFSAITRLNPRSAQAYWALGKVHATGRDEFEADPDDPDDPGRFYEIAARLQPETFFADGARIRLVEPMTPQREADLDAEAKARREAFAADVQSGSTRVRYAGEEVDSALSRRG